MEEVFTVEVVVVFFSVEAVVVVVVGLIVVVTTSVVVEDGSAFIGVPLPFLPPSRLLPSVLAYFV